MNNEVIAKIALYLASEITAETSAAEATFRPSYAAALRATAKA